MTHKDVAHMDESEWKGYISRAIEDIDFKLTELCVGRDENRRDIADMKMKSGVVSGLVSFLVSLVLGLVGWFVLHIQGK